MGLCTKSQPGSPAPERMPARRSERCQSTVCQCNLADLSSVSRHLHGCTCCVHHQVMVTLRAQGLYKHRTNFELWAGTDSASAFRPTLAAMTNSPYRCDLSPPFSFSPAIMICVLTHLNLETCKLNLEPFQCLHAHVSGKRSEAKPCNSECAENWKSAT
jgi:hypothetical protein